MHRLHAESYILINGKKYIIQHLLFYSDMIHGWAMLCFVVVNPVDGKQYVVKDCWTHSRQMTTEEDMLRIKEKHLTFGIPVLEAAWTVQISGEDDSTDLCRPNYLFKQGSDPPETRIHCCLLLTPIGQPLTHFSCIQELLSVLIDIVDGKYVPYIVM